MKRLIKQISNIVFPLIFSSNLISQSVVNDVQLINTDMVRKHIEFLASDSLLGRKAPSEGLTIAAEYIVDYYKKIGLKPVNGSYYQPVTLYQQRLADRNSLTVKFKSEKRILNLKTDFTPFDITGNNKVKGTLLFAGYGITAPEYGYDDYENINANGKIVVIFTHEPNEWDTTSVFKGTKISKYGRVKNKVQNAKEHGALGVILITDPVNHNFIMASGSPWPSLNKFLDKNKLAYRLLEVNEKESTTPVVQVGNTFINIVFESVDSLIRIQQKIDNNFAPNSFDIPDIKVDLETSITKELYTVNNVVGQIEGISTHLKNEYLIIGAHYDHVGYSKNAKPGTDSVRNGADDNASGTSALLTIAKAFTLMENAPKRSVLFVAFTAEELGLYGSRHYVDTPLIALDNTIAMLNLDMLGRNNPDTLYLHNAENNQKIVSVIKDQNQNLNTNFDLIEKGVSGGSDHAPFHKKGIPNIFFFAGLHEDYHDFGDNPDKIDFDKVARVSRLAFGTAWEISNTEEYFNMTE